jgi:hypothetical protein
VRDADGVPFLERVASCRCLGVLSGGVLEFPQTSFVFLGHHSGSHLNGTIITSVVALGDILENVDQALSLMTVWVTEEFGLQRLDASFGVGTLLFVLCVEVVHSLDLQEALHVSVPEFDALIGSQFGGFVTSKE